MTALRFPDEIAVGEVEWEDALEPDGRGHLLAIGVVEVPDGTAVTLSVSDVAEVTVSSPRRAGGWMAPAGTLRRRAARPGRARYRATWQRGTPGSAAGNTRSIWGEPGIESYSVETGDEPVDLEFLRALPADSVRELSLSDVVPASFAAVAHLAPGLRSLSLYLDDLGDDAPSVIAELTALESLRLYGNDDGPSRLDDHALSAIADLPALENLALLDGSYTGQGLHQLRRLPNLRHLHVEREGLTAPMFAFAANMPALTRLTGLDEYGDDGPMPPAEVDQVRAMLPHISMD